MTKVPEIFKSKFTLQFKNSLIQEIYETMRIGHIQKHNIIYSVINLILSISYCLIYALTFQERSDIFYVYFKYFAYIMTSIQGVFLALSIFVPNITLQKWITYINMCIFFVISMTLRIYVGNFAKLDYLILNMIYLTQQTYLLAWFFTNSIDFFEGFWVYLSISIISFAIFAPVHPLQLDFRFLIAAYLNMMSSLVSYFYVREKKKSFYFNYMNESTIKTYRSIIQNMNSGFVSIKNSTIASWNKSLFYHLKKINDKKESEINRNNLFNEDSIIHENNRVVDFTSVGPEKSTKLLEELFNGIVIESFNRPVEARTDYELTLEFLKNNQNNDTVKKENFIFIGTKGFMTDKIKNSCQYFEIFGRYCDGFKEVKEDAYEFIFNDVSKTKLSEEINAEMRYKTIFLSKVAHEFKNPLLCVSELIDQIQEDLQRINAIFNSNTISQSKVNNNLLQIKSMCEYLLILVKDLDFFSHTSTDFTSKIKLDKENVKLDKVIIYCKNITNVLLRKYEKDASIEFNVDCPQEISQREIFTDEVRLKQLLVNLLSNSVKYTYSGSITLRIKEENDEIVFSVIDTGKGLTEDQRKRLISSNVSNWEIGAHSSGLGFSIINEIIDLFKTKLNYEPYGDSGSKFSFNLAPISIIVDVSPHSLRNKNKNSNISEASDTITIQKNFSPLLNFKSLLDYNDQVKFKPKNEEKEEISSLKAEPDTDYYLVVDDESFTRKSTIRVLNNFLKSMAFNTRNKVILEAADGIECLNVFYQCMKKGIKLSFIISDQTMNFLNGDSCAKILKEIIIINNLKFIPYFIVTAYENFVCEENCIVKSYTKPLTNVNIGEILMLIEKNFF